MSETRKTIWSLVILAGLTMAVYSFAIHGSFKTMDDEYSIVRNEKIQSFKYLPEVLTSSFFGGNNYYRPLVSISFMKEYFFFKLNPVPYYLDNILLHIFNTFLVFGIVLTLIGRKDIALLTAILFALHPIHWEAVSNIPGRSILLCAFYSLASFYFFILSDKNRVFAYLSLLSFALALLSKESAGILPLIMISYLYFVKNQKLGQVRKYVHTLLPFAGVTALYLWIRYALGIVHVYPWRTGGEMALGFISFLRSVITDFRLFIMPTDLYFDRSQPFYLSYANPGVSLTILFFAVLIGLLMYYRHQISGVNKFLISWFFIQLLPVAQIVSTVGVQPGYISTAEHFLYMPSVAVFTLAALVFDYFKKKNEKNKYLSTTVLRVLGCGYIIFFVLQTIQFNIYSSNETAMFERTLAINPTNTRIRLSLALSYAKRNRFDLAEKNFIKVLELDPLNAKARIGLAKSLTDQGKYWEGIREYEKIAEPGSLKKLLDDNLRSTLLFLVARYEQKVLKDPTNARAYHSLGVIYSKLGNPERAVGYYEKALSYDENLKDSVYNLAATKEILGDREKAIELYQRVVMMRTTTEPDDLEKLALSRLGELARHHQDPRGPDQQP